MGTFPAKMVYKRGPKGGAFPYKTLLTKYSRVLQCEN